ncbi:MAG: hypothetical protein IJ060_08425 [Oscillospiraceae bacterium]|nr:hypothetical protein [Oscillospiraceae bacterium]
MDKPEKGKRPRLKTLHAAVILAGLTGILAAGSLFTVSGKGAARNPVWRPLLHARDSAVLQLGRDSLGNVYVTENRLLPYRERFDDAAVTASAEAVNALAEESGIPVYLVAVPTSAGIYGDQLPEYAPLANEHTMLRTLSSQLSENVVWIEAESWLSTEREQYIYYRTDPCWTGYGAFCVYRTAIRKLGFNPLGYDHFIVYHFSGDYYGRLVQESGYDSVQPDLVDLYRYDAEQPLKSVLSLRGDGEEQLGAFFREEEAEKRNDPALVFASNSEPVLYMETENQNSRELLLLTDSFGGSMIPLLLQHYHSVTAVNPELARKQKLDWRSLTEQTGVQYTQILVLCGADTLSTPGFAEAAAP